MNSNACTKSESGYYEMEFHTTVAHYQYACERANRLYRTLQDEREGQSFGLFNDTPLPVRLLEVATAVVIIETVTKAMAKYRDGGVKPQMQSGMSRITLDESRIETGSRYSHWPVPKPRWTLAELHELPSDGKIRPDLVWINAIHIPRAAETNP